MSTPSTSKPKPSNHKAIPDGLYSKYFIEADKQMLAEPFYADLMLEIALTRLYLARLELRLNNLKKKKSPLKSP